MPGFGWWIVAAVGAIDVAFVLALARAARKPSPGAEVLRAIAKHAQEEEERGKWTS